MGGSGKAKCGGGFGITLRVVDILGKVGGFGKVECGGDFRMDSESCECLEKLLRSLDMSHHPDADQILTTTLIKDYLSPTTYWM